ncbi:hypothetical protein BFP97_10805 [Roseivirga sp. 4D4]|uniref:hypothetical protein n=1 Tax=Roseivirga sp. 4D4 TaxID=1889784 RepID=UPI0008536C34|nr:hypothetical protein [Roseivirga sp. 4D4]OEK01977.1 hypothetical protein BFP97_10805 [Roseivirga sp. 4D4]
MKKAAFIIIGTLCTVGALAQTNTFPTTGNVGIGTITPGYKLHVTGTGYFSDILKLANNKSISWAGTTYASIRNEGTYMKYGATSGHYFDVGGTRYMSILSGGNVGIGTTSPQMPLHVVASNNGNDVVTFESTDGIANIYIKDNLGRSRILHVGDQLKLRANDTADHFIIDGGNNNIQFNSDALFIDGSTSNVGIGTISPLSKLQVSLTSNEPLSSAVMGNSGLVVNGRDGNFDLLSFDDNSTVSNNISFGRYNESTGALIHKFGITSWANTGITGSNSGDKLSFSYGVNKDIWTNSNLMVLDANGNVGIGADSPGYRVDVVGQYSSNYFDSQLHLHTTNNTYGMFLGSHSANYGVISQGGHYYSAGSFTARSNYSSGIVQNNGYIHLFSNSGLASGNTFTPEFRMTVSNNGNIGVGTTTPGEKLEVNGNALIDGELYSKKVKVSVNPGNWPDYVFASSYELRALSELEAFIKTNHHLPEVPSTEQVEKEGLDLGNMDAALLKKVEELTLYVLELEAGRKKLEVQNSKLRTNNQALENTLNEVIERLEKLEKK